MGHALTKKKSVPPVFSCLFLSLSLLLSLSLISLSVLYIYFDITGFYIYICRSHANGGHRDRNENNDSRNASEVSGELLGAQNSRAVIAFRARLFVAPLSNV